MASAAPAADADPSPQAARLMPELACMGFSDADCSAALDLFTGGVAAGGAGFSDAVALDRCTTFLLQSEGERAATVAGVAALECMGFGPRGRVIEALQAAKGKESVAMENMLRQDGQAEKAERARKAAPRSQQGANPAGAGASSSAAAASPALPAEPAAPGPTAGFSDEEVRRDLLVHRAVFTQDTPSLADYAKRGLLNMRDHRGRTPLLLAHALGEDWSEVMTFLLNRGADPRIKLPGGWSLLQQTCLRGMRARALDLHLHSTLLRQSEWESSQAGTMAALGHMEDFCMEIRWEITSWVPLVGRLAPRDSFKIWKRGGALRLDSKVVGMEGVNVVRGDVSYLFNQGTVWMIDRERGTVRDALEAFRSPDFENLQAHVDALCGLRDDYGAGAAGPKRNEMRAANVTFKEKKSFLGRVKHTTVDGYDCREVLMQGLEFLDLTLKEEKEKDKDKEKPSAGGGGAGASSASSSSSAAGAGANASSVPPDPDEYFDPDEMRLYNARRRIEEQIEHKKKRRVRRAYKQLQGAAAAAAPVASSAAPAAAASSSASSLAPPAASAAARRASSSSKSGGDDSDGADEDDDDDEFERLAQELSYMAPLPAPAPDPQIVVKSTMVDASLCLSSGFPLPLSQLLVLLELLSPASSLLAQLRDLLAVQLPLDPATGLSPFPVRITFPIFTQVNACVTFAAYEAKAPGEIPMELFEIPKNMRRF